MRTLLAALREAGVSELQTQTVSVWPNWGDESRLDGYVATNTVGGVVAVGRAGGAIDAAVAAGANQVYGPTLTSTTPASCTARRSTLPSTTPRRAPEFSPLRPARRSVGS